MCLQRLSRLTIFLLMASSILVGCKKDSGLTSLEEADAVYMRVRNISQQDFRNLQVILLENSIQRDHLSSGEQTDYYEIAIAYRYAYVELDVDTMRYTLQPIDFVGETPLDPGYYTYELDVIGSARWDLALMLVEDGP